MALSPHLSWYPLQIYKSKCAFLWSELCWVSEGPSVHRQNNPTESFCKVSAFVSHCLIEPRWAHNPSLNCFHWEIRDYQLTAGSVAEVDKRRGLWAHEARVISIIRLVSRGVGEPPAMYNMDFQATQIKVRSPIFCTHTHGLIDWSVDWLTDGHTIPYAIFATQARFSNSYIWTFFSFKWKQH